MTAARLRKPHDGLFSGTIDALDTVNSTYRITFDRVGFGTYSVPDIDVVVRIVSLLAYLRLALSGYFQPPCVARWPSG